MQINAIPTSLAVSPMTRDIPSGAGAALPIPGTPPNATSLGESQGTSGSFGQMLQNAISEVNQAQVNAADMTTRFAAGEPIDVHQVMIAGQEASTALNLALQVRNQLVTAYQEIQRTNM
jgi:flagellar hook-basal body complex protein FliE